MSKDILCNIDDYIFSYRVAGVVIKNDKVLLQRSVGTRDYAFPGGHVSVGEENAECIKREFKEEINAEVDVEELLWVGEIFFPWGSKKCHQICLYYAVELRDEIATDQDFYGVETFQNGSAKLSFEWIALNELDKVMIYPPQTKKLLIEKGFHHFIYHEHILNLKETSVSDLDNVRDLWNDGEVMKFVGFPEGLNITTDKLIPWLDSIIKARPYTNNYSIYANELGYCGEAFYSVDKKSYASLDIKLFKNCRGKGIAFQALCFVINKAFEEGKAKVVWVDPHPENINALKLYERVGFKAAEMPAYIQESELDGIDYVPCYMEINRDDWNK